MKRWGISVAFVTCLPSVARAEPSPGRACADAYVEGQRLRNAHKLIEAREAFRSCAQVACTSFIVRDCSEWLDGVQANIPAVIPVATDATGEVLSAVEVKMDGNPFVSTIDGGSLDVDPGLHTFSFEAADGRKVDTRVLVVEGDKAARISVKFPGPRTLAPPVPASSVASLASPDPGAAHRNDLGGPWKTVGLVVAGVGVLGLGAGAGFGLDAWNKKNTAGCNDRSPCASPDATDQLAAAQRSGNLSTAFFIAGAALATSGVLLWIVSPGHPVAAVVSGGNRGASLALRGAW